jgi:hypothetical protein
VKRADVSAAAQTAGSLVAGRYLLEKAIAVGGMAEVWQARDTFLVRPVALKVPLAHVRARPDLTERFRREAVAAGRLNHPNVVAVYDTGVDPSIGSYLVMELVQGPSLREVLDQEGPLGVEHAVDIAAQVASALSFAHRAGVVHRDVKPANILVADRLAKVVDFGIAKATFGDDATQTDVTLGTARYLSPEQVEGRQPDERSDLYSLGVVLYEMVCGCAPYDADSDLALALKHLTGEPPLPSSLRPDVPKWLEELILRALSKSPDDRQQTAADFRRELVSRTPTPSAQREVDTGEWPVVAPIRSLSRDDSPTTAWESPPRAAVDSVPSPPRGGLRRGMIAALGLLLVGGLAAGGVGLARGHGHGRGRSGAALAGASASTTAGGGANRAVPIAAGLAFDPEGDGIEDNADLPLLYDGNTSTAWHTEHYTNEHFGNLKGGVGFIVQTQSRAALRRLRLFSQDQGWTFEVYESSQLQPGLAGWGKPVASATMRAPSVSVNLPAKQAAYVLVWITDLGPGNTVVGVGEAQLFS